MALRGYHPLAQQRRRARPCEVASPASSGRRTTAPNRPPSCANRICLPLSASQLFLRRDMADLDPELLTPDQCEEIREAFKVR